MLDVNILKILLIDYNKQIQKNFCDTDFFHNRYILSMDCFSIEAFVLIIDEDRWWNGKGIYQHHSLIISFVVFCWNSILNLCCAMVRQ